MPFVNHGGSRWGMSNCAMCTIAAIVGHQANTADIARVINVRGQSDDHLATGFGHDSLEGVAQLQAILNSMIELIVRMKAFKSKQVNGSQYGVPGIGKTAAEIDTYILMKPEGSKFAVWGCQSHVIMGARAHWNYAQAAQNAAEYRDYQDNNGEGMPYYRSSSFIQPRGQSRDSRERYDNFIALCFTPK